MISVVADTDAASSVLLPRFEANPHTDQATANAPLCPFYSAGYLSLYISLSFPVFHFFLSSFFFFFFFFLRATL